jgi:transposase-like protein
VPFEERLRIVNEFLSGEIGDKAAICKKYNITKDTFDNWKKRQTYYRAVLERGTHTVHSETGKRTSVLKKLHQLEDLPVEEAISVLKDWRNILHKDAVAARFKADELATRVTAVDIGIFKLVESVERDRQSMREKVKKIAGGIK